MGKSARPRAVPLTSATTRTAGILTARPFEEWLLPAAKGVLLLKIVLVVVVFDPIAYDAFALPKVAASRATSYLLLALLFLLTLRHGRRLWSWSPLYIPLALYVGAHLVAIPFAFDQILALYGAPTRFQGITTILDNAFLAVATATLTRSVADARALAAVSLAAAVPVLTYALLQRLDLDPVPWFDRPSPRAFSTFGNAGPVGAYFAMVGSVTVALLMWEWAILRRPLRVALLGLMLVAAAGVVLSGARASVLGIVAGIGSSVALQLLAGRAPLQALAFGGAALVGLGVAVLTVLPIGSGSDRLVTSLFTVDEVRLVLWDTALRTVLQRPLVGAGPDNFAAAYAAYRSERSIDVFATGESSPHSWVFQAALGAGIPGLVAYLSLLALAAMTAVRRARRGVTAAPIALATVAAFLGQGIAAIGHPALDLLSWVALGVIAAPALAPDDASNLRTPPAAQRRVRAWSRGRIAFAVLVLAASMFAVWSTTRAVAASRALNLSLSADRVGEHVLALAAAREAVVLDPNRAANWAALGNAQLRRGDARSALASFERAASLAPYFSGHWRNVATARLELARADPRMLAPAFDAAQRAVAAEPADPLAHDLLARIALEMGKLDVATREAERAVDLNPRVLSFYDTASVAYARASNWSKAEEFARRGLEVSDWVPLRMTLARIYLVTGRKAEAIRELNVVIAADPGHAEAFRLLEAASK